MNAILSQASLSSETVLSAEGLKLAYGAKVIAEDLNLSLKRGKISIIVGANGCGKSTFLKALARINRPAAGTIRLEGQDIFQMPGKAVAQRVAFLPQSPIAPSGISVADLVGRGRYPHQGWFRRWGEDDDVIVEEALRATHTLDFADRSVDSLSGGQRQRVWMAMILAQRTDILLLDEPTTYLDISHQIQLLDLLAEFNRTRKCTVIAVLHELNLAVRYAHNLIGFCAGKVAFDGPPAEVVTAQNLRDVFSLKARVETDLKGGFPIVIPECHNGNIHA